MSADRHPLEEYFVGAVSGLQRGAAGAIDGPVRAGSALTVRLADELFTAQCESRHADLAAKYLQAQGRGYYTIASAGHEGNAAVAAALRPSDPALLHYRSGGFYCARAHQVQGHDPVYDILAGVVSAVTEPIAGGRHKVFGNHDLAVIPQTSTIASHLPRAVGVAFGIDRARRLGLATPWPDDAIVVTSFGDASVNHSTLVGAFNSTSNTVYQGIGVPMLMVCEDNGFGISTRTPSGWIAQCFSGRPGLRYFAVDGCDLADVYDAAAEAVDFVRANRKPAFLHLRTVRFLGHAGSDAEVAYRTPSEISADYARDPLLASARLLAAAGAASGTELLERYEAVRARTAAVAAEVSLARQLASAEEVLSPLAPRSPRVVAATVGAAPSEGCQARDTARAAIFGGALPEHEGPLTLAQSINRALHDELARRPAALVFGEDVSAKGGVYGLTRGLRKTFGGARVFDTLLDEQAILGLALGTSLAGFLPIPEIQYLAYLHNAEDQLRGEASTLQFFSQGQYRNPMVVRVAGLGYQRGFGGHFHNDNSVAVLRDIPGLVVGVPSHPRDAAAMLRTLTAAAVVDGTVSVFLEPIALYHQRNLYAEGDNGWLADYLPPREWADGHVPIGRARRWLVDDSDGTDLTILTFGNGVPMSLRTAKLLSEKGISVRVVDLRWLAPLPVIDILGESEATGRVLIVDETRRSGGVSEGVITALVDGGFGGVIERVTSADSFIPLGDAARAVLLDEPTVVKAALGLLGRG